MTPLRVLVLGVCFACLACSSDAEPESARSDAAADTGAETAADAAETSIGCPTDAGASICTSETGIAGGGTRTWSGCSDGKTYELACGPVGDDGQRDCTCKADGATLASFRAVTPADGVVGGTAWSNVFACYCAVRP